MFYIVSSRIARATSRDPHLKQKKKGVSATCGHRERVFYISGRFLVE